MLLRLAILLLALLPLPAAAQAGPSPSLSGSWALVMEGSTIFRFDIRADGAGWAGTWWRPRTFAIEGDAFQGLSGPPVQVPAGGSKAIGAWTELTFPDNRPGAVPDVFRIRLLGENRAELIYADTGVAPFVVQRVPATTPPGPWQQGRKYRRATVASLGLPPDPQVAPPAPRIVQAPSSASVPVASSPSAAPKPAAPTWTLPPGTKAADKPVMVGR